ncbi:MAG: GNAT family N-acetyltransferase [Bdellovibrionales bacterium]|nr:GNAT family N-acetyltransferase [Bdellovibrionales bacterium]
MLISDATISADELRQIAALHRTALPDSIFSLCGKAVLYRYYQFVSESPREALIWLTEEKQVLGAAVLSFAPEQLSKRFVRWAPVFVGIRLGSRAVLNPKLARKVLHLATNKAAPPSAVQGLPEIVQIFAAPHSQNRGIGTKMLNQAEQFLFQQQARQYCLKTQADDTNPANGFYLKRGFELVAEAAFGGRAYKYYLKALG